MKKIKNITLIALSVSLILCLFPFTLTTVSASTNHSQDEAVSWIKARADEGWWEDVDGAYGCQCVDLIMKYYKYLVGYRVGGNACDYWSNSLPSGWYRDYTPSPGSIIVWKGNANAGNGWSTGANGHIGLVYAVSGSTVYTVECNVSSPYDGGKYYACAKYRKRNPQNVIYIHPDFSGSNYKYTDITANEYYLKNVATGKYLSVDGCADVNKANISVGTWEVSSGLKYAVTSAPDGYIMRPLCSPKRVVNAWGSAPSRGANVNLYDYCSESSQWWKFEPVDGGYIIHSSFDSSCVLDTDGSNVLIEKRHGGTSQIWVLQTQEEAEAENLGNNFILGDVNEDGKVNLKDVSTIIKYRALWNPDPFNFEAADICKDGNINARDTIYLIRHLANWKGYEL